MTFHKIITQYIESKINNNPATISNCKRIATFFGDTNPQFITENFILNYIFSRKKINAKSATINRELTIIKQIFKYAHQRGFILANPSILIPYEKNVIMRDRWLTPEEENTLIRHSPQWLSRIIIFATSTGMRRAEILNLKHKNINTILKTVELTMTKNGQSRIIPLTNRAFQSIIPNDTEYVFVNMDGNSIKIGNLEYSFRMAVRISGIQNLHFHDLRHTFATRLAQYGVDLYTIQRLLGHKNPSMTQRYAHHCVDSLRRAVEGVPGV